jgi:hypothetical protein
VACVLGVECLSKVIQPLCVEFVWVNADWMCDTKHISSIIVDGFEPAIVTVPLRITTHFERDLFLIFEVVLVFEHSSDAELKRTSLLIPIERIQVVSDKPMECVSVVAVAPVTWRTVFFITDGSSE